MCFVFVGFSCMIIGWVLAGVVVVTYYVFVLLGIPIE